MRGAALHSPFEAAAPLRALTDVSHALMAEWAFFERGASTDVEVVLALRAGGVSAADIATHFEAVMDAIADLGSGK